MSMYLIFIAISLYLVAVFAMRDMARLTLEFNAGQKESAISRMWQHLVRTFIFDSSRERTRRVISPGILLALVLPLIVTLVVFAVHAKKKDRDVNFLYYRNAVLSAQDAISDYIDCYPDLVDHNTIAREIVESYRMPKRGNEVYYSVQISGRALETRSDGSFGVLVRIGSRTKASHDQLGVSCSTVDPAGGVENPRLNETRVVNRTANEKAHVMVLEAEIPASRTNAMHEFSLRCDLTWPWEQGRFPRAALVWPGQYAAKGETGSELERVVVEAYLPQRLEDYASFAINRAPGENKSIDIKRRNGVAGEQGVRYEYSETCPDVGETGSSCNKYVATIDYPESGISVSSGILMMFMRQNDLENIPEKVELPDGGTGR